LKRLCLSNTAVGVAAIVAAMGLLEIATRILIPDPYLQFENRAGLFARDDLVGFKNQPDFRAYAHGNIRVRTNHMGYRGEEMEVQKPPGAIRILALGDSVTWGVGVNDDRIYLARLEQTLNARYSRPLRVQTVNTAVIGYSLYQELLTLERDGPALSPDIVLVGFVLNDAYPTEDPFFNVNSLHEPRKEGVRRRAYSDPPPAPFHLYRLSRTLARRALDRFHESNRSPRANYDWQPGSFEQRSWPVMQHHFQRMAELSKTRHFRLLIILFPTGTQFRSGSLDPFPQSMIKDFMKSEGIDYLDLFDTLRGRQDGAFRDEMHLTPLGHQEVAESILRNLDERHWLPESGVRHSATGP